MNRNLYIQGLRGALAMAVFFYHVVNSKLPTFTDLPGYAVLDALLHSFEFGVEIFFGVSGIVIVFAFRKSKTVSHFLIDRISRIYPVLWVTVLCIFLLSMLDRSRQIEAGPLVLVGNLLALPPLVPIKLIHPAAWTISYEFLFYTLFVIFGLLALRVGKRAALYLVLAAGAAFIFLHLRAMPFFIGMAVAYVAGKKDSPLARFKFSGLAIFGSMLCWHLGNLAQGSQYATLPELLVSPLATLLYLGGGVLAFFGLLGVYSGHGLFCRLMVTPVFQWLGGLSFSLYMWQAITMAIIKKGMYVSGLVEAVGPLSQLLFLLLALPPTLVISRLSQVYLEGHATRWMRGYANRKMTVAGPVPTVSE